MHTMHMGADYTYDAHLHAVHTIQLQLESGREERMGEGRKKGRKRAREEKNDEGGRG